MAKVVKCTNKDTGETYYAEVKQSWGKTYWSVDCGDTWHKSAKAARKANETTNA